MNNPSKRHGTIEAIDQSRPPTMPRDGAAGFPIENREPFGGLRHHGALAHMGRVHIFGASGSGCTTLGAHVSEQFGYPHLHADDYYWLPSEPPFVHVRERTQRVALLRRDIETHDDWVLSGSVCGWGDLVIPRLTLAVFLIVPTAIRMERLARRERLRRGVKILPGGAEHERHTAFMTWASCYDDGDVSMRSRALHETWLPALSCRVSRIEGDVSTEDALATVVHAMASVEM